jgi:putative colanic acid biosynthesis acetyltransferase WcaF
LRPAFTRANRARRALWNLTWLLLFRPSPRPLHAWRTELLRFFGATLGPHCHIYPAARIWAPWNLICADHVAIADHAEIYNPALIELHSHVIISQGAYLCGATHNIDDPAFPLIACRMTIGAYAWICARASVSPGAQVGEGAVLGLASVATQSLTPWTVYSGNPAQPVRERKRSSPTLPL